MPALPRRHTHFLIQVLRLLHESLLRYSTGLGGVPVAVRDVKLAAGDRYGRLTDGNPHVRVCAGIKVSRPIRLELTRFNDASSTRVGEERPRKNI